MRIKLLIAIYIISLKSVAQELFVFTEPASNMAAKNIGLRVNNYLMRETETNVSLTNFLFIPEIMVGVSKKIMLHGDIFFDNRNAGFAAKGGSVYGKYRFLSNDDVQTHFRMALFARAGFNNNNIDRQEINLYGYNSGFEGGVVATKLLHKVALSSGLSFFKAINNGGENKFPYSNNDSKAVNYTLSVGKLMLPKEYKDYRQTNVNLLLELLSQLNAGSGKYYFDVAPSAQFIFNSVARVDIGYRKEVTGTLSRTSASGIFLRLEYNFFNAY